jgi:uncharacterized protein (TIGR02145 family)
MKTLTHTLSLLLLMNSGVISQNTMTIQGGARVTVHGNTYIVPCPAAPSVGTHVSSETQIIWNWSTVTDATGYKWNTTNDYNTAIDLGPATTKTETGLTCNTAYTRYTWAFNDCGPSTSVQLSQTTSACPFVCGQPLTDTRNGKVYNTVLIGPECWMAQDLNIGTKIPAGSNQTDNGILEKYCINDDESNCSTYGGLYQWDESMQYSPKPGIQGVCPAGWHLPTDAALTNLVNFMGGESAAGGPLKEAGYVHWYSPNTGATNSSGFTALPSGMRATNGTFLDFRYFCTWWSSTASDATHAWSRYACYNNTNVNHYSNPKAGGFSIRCVKDCDSISSPTGATNTSAQTQIIWSWNPVAGALGYKWNTSNNFSTATDLGAATTKTETGLTCNTFYTRFAWAYNTCTYSTPVMLITNTSSCSPNCGQIVDTRDGKVYNTVIIGTQCWMAQDLNIGAKIPGITTQTDNGTIEKYCMNDDENNCSIYGGLYQWDEAMQYSTTPGVLGICPTGWHIPIDASLTTLINYLGGESAAGGPMKEAGYVHWLSPNTGATNSSGFTALPAGRRASTGAFYDFLSYGTWLSSTMSDATHAWSRYACYNSTYVYQFSNLKAGGFSIRCLRD